jgi:acyl dehydratase
MMECMSISRTLSDTDFTTSVDDRYYEDYVPGRIYEYGYASVTQDEIIDFATKFDPQPIHIDPQYAASGPFGGIIASGWHTGSVFMRLFADHYVSRVASMASPGMDEVRWAVPLRPGDSLRLRTTIEQARVSRSKPDRGLVHTRAELINQDDLTVMSLVAMALFRRRDAARPA